MAAAFETLGIPSYHWVKMVENPPDTVLWAEALESKFDPTKQNRMALDRGDFDHLMGHVGACTDQPAAVMAEELVAAYPEAKVILVERDVDKWYESFSSTVIAGFENPVIPFVTKIDRTFLGPMFRLFDLASKHYFHVQEKREFWCMNNPAHFEQLRQNAKAAYRAHNELVKRVTPPERLLLFKLEQGWNPLCKFLGKPVPDCPFPRINDAESVTEKISLYITEGIRRGLVDIAKKAVPIVVLALSVVFWQWRK